MDPTKLTHELCVTRQKWSGYDFTVTRTDAADAPDVDLKLRPWYEGYISMPASNRMLLIGKGYCGPNKVWGVHEALPGALFNSVAVVKRQTKARPYYIIEADEGRYVVRRLGINNGDREVRLVPDGAELDSAKGATAGEVVGEIKFDSVGKRLYSVKFLSDVPQVTQAMSIWVAIAQGKMDETVVEATKLRRRRRSWTTYVS